MNQRLQLRHLLARQWVIFTVTLFSGFALLAVLLSFMLEDSFIDQRLDDVASSQRFENQPLPAQFFRYPIDQASSELRQKMHNASIGSIREFRMDNGQYLHVRLSENESGERFFLAYDVSDQLFVNTALQNVWPLLLSIIILLATLAWYLANRLSRHVAEHARNLIQQLGACDDVATMQQLAQAQTVFEFAELARLNAEALQRHVDSLNREKETLAFLSHELRTPMQSIQNSVDLLESQRDHQAAFERLQRASRRLQRAAQSILWLASSSKRTTTEPCAVQPILASLINEFSSLAATRQQHMICQADDTDWPMPTEIIETVIANVLLNAIQHGDSGEIHITLTTEALTIRNPATSVANNEGFGLGLQIVQRLLKPFAFGLRYQHDNGVVEIRIAADPVDIDICY